MINTGISPGGTSDSVRGVWRKHDQYNSICKHCNTRRCSRFGDLVTSGGWMGGASNGHGV